MIWIESEECHLGVLNLLYCIFLKCKHGCSCTLNLIESIPVHGKNNGHTIHIFICRQMKDVGLFVFMELNLISRIKSHISF